MSRSTTTRRPRLGVLISTAAAVALVPAFLVAPAQAEPPANDDISGATVVTTTPGTYSVDTTEATADRTDGRRVGAHSVWFTFRSDHTGRFALTTAGSSYDTQLAVFAGPRNHRRLVDADRNRGPGDSAAVRTRVHDGVKYWIAVSSQGPSPSSGTALLTIGQVANPGFELTNLEATSGSLSGRLTVTADVTCTTESLLYVYVRASQRVGDNVALGYWDAGGFDCRPDAPIPVTLEFDSVTGWAFQPGQAVLSGSYEIWDGITWDYTSFDPVVVDVVDAPLARQTR